MGCDLVTQLRRDPRRPGDVLLGSLGNATRAITQPEPPSPGALRGRAGSRAVRCSLRSLVCAGCLSLLRALENLLFCVKICLTTLADTHAGTPNTHTT